MFKGQTILWLLSLGIGLSLSLDVCEHQLNGTRLLHPADCNKFVKCQNGKTDEIKSCPLGLHFNRFKSVCDLPQRAACDVAYMNFTTSENTNCSACCSIYGCYVKPECPETPGTTAPPTNPDFPETPTPTTPVTPATPETAVTTENPATSESSTTTESPVTSETPVSPEQPTTTESPDTPGPPTTPESPTTHESTGTPETPDIPGTPNTPVTPAIPETPATPETPVAPETPATPENPTTTESPATPATPSTLPTPATPAPENDNNCTNNLRVCIGKPDGSISLVNGTCNQYIVCVGGCAIIMSCPNNLQYNIRTQHCDYPENVDCPWQSTPPVTGPSGVTCAHAGKCANQSDGKLFADPNGNGYIVCQCECEIERPCSAGTEFNEHLLTCVLANGSDNGIGDANGGSIGNGNGSENVNGICSNDIQICKNQTEGTLFPIDGVCNKFYKCNFGCAVEIICPNNLIYNPRKEYCDYPQNYKCPWPHTPPSGPTAGPSGIACASGGRCVGQPEGTLFPSRSSCAKYVVCQCECEVEMDCSGNLLWDSSLLACNYPSKVTCDLSFALNDA